VSWSLLLTGRTVVYNARARFGIPAGSTVKAISERLAVLAVLLAVPMVAGPFSRPRLFGMIIETGERRWLWHALAALGGGVAAYIVAVVALWFAARLAPPGLPINVAGFPGPAWVRAQLTAANARGSGIVGRVVTRIGIWVTQNLPISLWKGYLDPHSGLPWDGVWLSFNFAAATAAVITIVNLIKLLHLGQASPIPTIGFVLIFLLGLNWILGFLAFQI